jgi:hypothetical protein
MYVIVDAGKDGREYYHLQGIYFLNTVMWGKRGWTEPKQS